MHKVGDNPYQISDSLFIKSISEEVNQMFVNIEIQNKKTPISFKVHTVNDIPLHIIHRVGCNKLEYTSQRLSGYFLFY